MKNRITSQPILRIVLTVAVVLVTLHTAWARDAAFVDPMMAGGTSATPTEAIKVEPKSEIDIGDTTLGVARRTSLFFINQTTAPIQIEKISVTGDSNVAAEASSDDCSKQQTIAPLSRCSVEISVTPTSAGAWGVDVLMTHNGPGRIVRAKIGGKTSGGGVNDDKKSMGLTMNNKEVSLINFGDIEIGGGKAVRSALMINDSAEPITVFSIEVIEAENGLQKLEQGCAVDMELRSGESCPVTLLWTPQTQGIVSTDLIIRHSGKMGFTVIPIRGTAKGNAAIKTTPSNAIEQKGSGFNPLAALPDIQTMNGKNDYKPQPASHDIGNTFDKIPSSALTPSNSNGSTTEPKLRLIGTVGHHAIILKPEGTTIILGAGDEIETNSSARILVTAVNAKSVDISIDGKKKTLPLQAAADLISQAAESKKHEENSNNKSGTPAAVTAPTTTPSTPPSSPPPSGGSSQ